MTSTGLERVEVDKGGARQRLDRYLTTLGRWGSRAQVQRLIAAGGVRLEGQVAKPSAVLRAGQMIDVEVPVGVASAGLGVEAEAIPLDVLYEDDWLLAINKQPGLVVHPAPGHWRGTLVSALLHHWQGSLPGLDATRPGIVHRLDKDTSGVLVIAKDADTLAALGRQFRDRVVEKQYVAVVWGRVRQRTGTIAQPIARNPVHRKRMAVRSGGRAAVTSYEVIDEGLKGVTVVRLFPKTGRTHQIRVHLAALGHPIVGDAVYGRSRSGEPRALIDRQALHAERIAFLHPRTNSRVSFVAPLPADMQRLLAALA